MYAIRSYYALFVNNFIFNWDPAKRNGSRSVYKGKKGKIFASIVGNMYFAHPSDEAHQISFKNVPRGSKVFLKDNRYRVLSSGEWKSRDMNLKSDRSKEVDNAPVWIASLKAKSAEETPASYNFV